MLISVKNQNINLVDIKNIFYEKYNELKFYSELFFEYSNDLSFLLK